MDRKVLIELLGKDKTGVMFKSLNRNFAQIGKGLRQMASFGKYMALGLTGAVYAAVPFGRKMAEVSTMIDTSKYNMKQFRAEVLALSRETGRGPTELAEALRQTISAGVAAGDAMKFLEISVKGAIGGVAETVEVVDLLTNAMNAYGMSVDSASRISDIAFKTVFLGKTTMSELAASMGQVLPFAAQLNVSLEDLFAATATLTKGGLDTAAAATQLKAVLSAVIKPGSDAADTARSLGLAFDVSSVRAMGFFNWLMQVRESTEGNTETLARLFPNVRGLGAVLGLTGKQAEEFAKIQREVISSTGAMGEAYRKVADDEAVKLEKEINNLKVQVIEIGNAVIPVILSFVKWAKENPTLTKTIGGLTAGLIALKMSGIVPIATGFAGLAKSVGQYVLAQKAMVAAANPVMAALGAYELKLAAIGGAQAVAIAGVAAIGYKFGEYIGKVSGLHDWIIKKFGGEMPDQESLDATAWKKHLSRAQTSEDVRQVFQGMYSERALRAGATHDVAFGGNAPTLKVENINIGNPDEIYRELERQLRPKIRELEQRYAAERYRQAANHRVLLQD